jgi:hypothetical protein
LWENHFFIALKEILKPYTKKGVVVINDEDDEVKIYDSQIEFIYNDCLPLLAMRSTEYYAEVLGKEHAEYQFVKNISKRKFGLFLVKSINPDSYLLEHIPSKTEIVLSKEFSAYKDNLLTENKSVMCVGIVNWKDNIWQMMGGAMLIDKDDAKANLVGEHIFDDMAKKLEVIKNTERAFLKVNNGSTIAFVKGKQEYIDLNCEVTRTYTQMINPNISDSELNKDLEIFRESCKNFPLDEKSPTCVFFNPKSGIEIYHEDICRCISDKNNPFYVEKAFDLELLITEPTISKEFIDYIVENQIIKLELDASAFSPYVFPLLMDNMDFMLRFYRKRRYWTEPNVSIGNYTEEL